VTLDLCLSNDLCDNGASIKLIKRVKTTGEPALFAIDLLHVYDITHIFFIESRRRRTPKVLARTCALILTSATVRWPRSPSLCTFFFNIDTRTLRYIYFLRLTASDTRNDRYDNLHFTRERKNKLLKQRIAREISRMNTHEMLQRTQSSFGRDIYEKRNRIVMGW